MNLALKVSDLNVTYRGVPAVIDYSVELAPGTLTMMLGRNGAGKTSALRGIVGFLPGETGRSTLVMELLGKSVKRPNPLELCHEGLVLIAERNKVFTGMTVGSQFKLVAKNNADITRVLEYFPRIKERLDVRAGLLSGGERQMVATCLALLKNPQVLLVDELSLGLAPTIVADLMQYLRRLADEQGLAILAADQNVVESLKVADYVQVMDDGHVVAQGGIDELDVDKVLDTYVREKKA